MRQLGGCGGEFAVAVAWTQFTSVGQEYLRLDNAFVAGAGYKGASRSRCQLHRKRESRHRVNGCETAETTASNVQISGLTDWMWFS